MKSAALVSILAVVIAAACKTQQPGPLDIRITSIAARMASQDLATRNAALDDLVAITEEVDSDPQFSDPLAAFLARHPEHAERVKLGLIQLLQANNNIFIKSKPTSATYTENDMEHYAQAIEMVASLDDERAIPALVGAMTVGGVATGGLLQHGDKALEPVLRELANPNPLVRSKAVSVGIAILRTKNDTASHNRILDMIRAAISDKEFLVRSSALWAIGDLAAADQRMFVPDLQQLAKSDSFIVPGESSYPLRIRAKGLLNQISSQ